MTTPDVPAGRGRDELREKLRHLTRDSGPLGSAVCALLKAAEAELPVMVMPDESRAIVDLLVPQETRADDPETDGTDFAHPAYFRGKRDGIRGAVDALERVLDHGRRGGTFGDERLQAFAARLDSLRAVAQDAPPPPPTTPDVPATERERDEHVERVTNALEEAMAQHGLAFEPVDDAAEVGATLAALLARREAPTEGISLSAQLSQAAAWRRVWDECQRLGMDTYGAPSTRTGLDIVLDFIRGRAAPQETPPILSRKHANEIAYFLRRPDMAHDAKRERLASLVERAGAAPQEAPICLQCIERAEQEIAAGHYYRADELMAALRERREPVCACGETHPDRTPLAAARPAPEAREPEAESLVAALRAIIDMAPAEATEASDESARCTCEWMSPEDGSVHARWPAVLDARCAVHSREEAESEAALPAESTERSES